MLRIAVLRLSSLGDVLLATPLIRQLRHHFPEAELMAVVRRQYGDLLAYNPRLTAVVLYETEGPFWQARTERQALRRGLVAPDQELWIVDLHRNVRTWYLRWGKRAQLFRAPKERWRKLLLVWAKRWGWWSLSSIPERYRKAVAELNVEGDGDGLEFWLPEERTAAVYPPAMRPWPQGFRRIALVPGARHATKRWLSEHFIALGYQLHQWGCELVVIGAPDDAESARSVAAALPEAELVVTPSLLDLARRLDTVDLVVGNDSGILHLAAARRIPVVVLFGSTVPELGFVPVGVPSAIVQYPIPCRPCTHIGRRHCPQGHFRCMRAIEPRHVLHSITLLQEWCRRS
ncbi:MAG: glycosyltransferase family 9 protein [Candidatus Kapabacteria bacterium]|nr:glycosyltransferase family 9 protein [Candidatus Kapabacteria bacterium]MCS7169789.1 glycosyltransferase family 9 protein [Candidatus Kapabacteria bacterium]MDW7996305.1 glycosyltransferase family 9 protein [Bacteroidota bacterium]MDW8225263.1 glycosyltransferase family 9 protein [Bacteroidota bacterium]